jgi:F-type H+-transporting ATPase subunit epsilon
MINTFTLHLQDAQQNDHIDGVTSFVGEDDSGGFGIRAGHERMMTSLVFGMARFASAAHEWEYVAVPRALLYFRNNELVISTRRYFRSSDYSSVADALTESLQAEEAVLRNVRESLFRMEDEMLKRLWQMSRAGRKLL